MAVWLLDGPNEILGLKPDVAPVYVTFGEWYPKVGLILFGDFGEMGVVTLDGQYQFRAKWVPQMTSWWPERERMVGNPIVQYLGNTQYMEMVYEPMAWFQQTIDGTENFLGVPEGTNYVKLPDRFVYLGYGGQLYGLKDGVATPEGPVLGFNIGGIGLVHAGRTKAEIFVTGTKIGGDGSAWGVFYNTVFQQLASPYLTIGMPAARLVYAPEYGVLVSCHSDYPAAGWRIRVWSLDVHPTQMKPVEVFQGTPESGQVVTYRVQVVGDQQDPAPGELVEWALEGTGLLLDGQSVTGDDGYAQTQVQYQLEDTGSSTLKASVLC